MMQSVGGGLVHLIEEKSDVRLELATALRDVGCMIVIYDRPAPFFDILPTLSPGCVVSDIASAELENHSLLKAVKASGRPLPVILVTDDRGVSRAVEAMKLGAADVLQWPTERQRLRAAVSAALKEADLLGAAQEFLTNLARLTQRERQVFNLVVQGESNKAIARRLEISPRTVEIYRANVMLKMHADNASELIRTAVKSGTI